jgi:hypothetical protein
MTIRHNKEPQTIDAIIELKTDAIVSTFADGSIVWHDDNPTNITDKQISDKLAVLVTEYDAQVYARKRQAEYPSIGDQLDMQYHDQLNGTTTWKDAIAKVKADNPKENK